MATAGRQPDKRLHRTPLALAVVLVVVTGVVLLAGLGVSGYMYLLESDNLDIRARTPQIIEIAKIALAVVGGIGGAVALVVAYRRQGVAEKAHDLAIDSSNLERTRVLNERFVSAVEQLGSDAPAVRMGGVYSLAGLADDWPEERQRCIDVLCGYLRFPIESDASTRAADVQVRNSIVAVIREHLCGQEGRWDDSNLFDLTGAELDDFDLSSIKLYSSSLVLDRATVRAGLLNMYGLTVDGGVISGKNFEMRGGRVDARKSFLLSGSIDFSGASFGAGDFDLSNLYVDRATANFENASFHRGARLVFERSVLTLPSEGRRAQGARLSFEKVRVSGGEIVLDWLSSSPSGRQGVQAASTKDKREDVSFMEAVISTGRVSIDYAHLNGVDISFQAVRLRGGLVSLDWTVIRNSEVSLSGAEISGGLLRFDHGTIGELSSTVVDAWCMTIKNAESYRSAKSAHYEQPGPQIFARGLTMTGGVVSFSRSEIDGALLDFSGSSVTGGALEFEDLVTGGSAVSFFEATVADDVEIKLSTALSAEVCFVYSELQPIPVHLQQNSHAKSLPVRAP